jgi:hypothetical protein
LQKFISSILFNNTSRKQNQNLQTLFNMKFMIALFALFAAASAQILTTRGLYGGQLLASPYAGVLPSSRFSRSDWIQPGLRYNVPAVAQYNTITPGFTTLTRTSTPVVPAAPLLTSAGLIGAPVLGGGIHAPLTALPYIR